jgi:hypothetical protein
MKPNKKFSIFVVFVLTLTLVVINMNSAFSAELTIKEQVQTFLKDVARFDVARYSQARESLINWTSEAGLPNRVSVYYSFEDADGKEVGVACEFRNNALVICDIYAMDGQPVLYTQTYANNLDAIKSTLDKYQTYSGFSSIQEITDTLNAVTETKNMTATTGNIKLTVSTTEVSTTYNWKYIVNGLDTRNQINIGFENGVLVKFYDGWTRYTIGNTDVKVSREQAFQIAMDYAKDFSYGFAGTMVGNFTFKEEPKVADLNMDVRANDTVYPLWTVTLPLDKVYPADITAIRVMLWADTGEVVHITPSGPLGNPSDGEEPAASTAPSTEPSSSLSPTQQPTSEPSNSESEQANTPITTYLIAGALAIAVAVILSVVVTNKRSKHQK